MERVKKGEKYWYIGADKYIPILSYDMRTIFEDDRYRSGNYFTDYSEAEAMAKKLRAVLKGAEVIEMPSEDEFNKQIKEIGVDKQNIELCKNDSISLSLMFGALQMLNWLKSKIVK